MTYTQAVATALRNASESIYIVRDKGSVIVRPAVTRKRIAKSEMREAGK